ncbi:class IV adenylate cyclase [Streptomyces sp. NPDC051569]|uniref:class IV adenylate cyclase n=1 Tax=Streptomyces sp. NPDC051569 TaxID=3365661 RepID=UPI0037A04F4E
MIEAELKARVREPEAVMRALESLAGARVEVYQDTYYDRPHGDLHARDQELRVRTVNGQDDTRTVLTFKDAKVDEESGSKPEYETGVEDAETMHAIARGLGYVSVIVFEKRCRNYSFTAHGRQMLATLVRVPEIDGTFIELETLVDETDVPAALATVRAVLVDLGIDESDLTREKYTDAVQSARRTDQLSR